MNTAVDPIFWQSLIDWFRKELVAAQSFRLQLNKAVPSNNPNEKGLESEWIVFERQTMFDAVNSKRQELKLDPVSMHEIVRAETMASGHIDYTQKFSLYCAELAVGRRPTP